MKKNQLILGITSVFCTLGLTFCNNGSGLPVLAKNNASVRQLSVSEAIGGQGQPPLIELAPGMGVNLSFVATGETIKKVWLDNPSFVTLDVDGCLAGLGTRQEARNCSGAFVLHIRRINPLQFRNLPKANSSLLTVITSANRVYLFKIIKVAKPRYYTVEIIPRKQNIRSYVSHQYFGNQPNRKSQLSAPITSSLVILNCGLQVAIKNQFLKTSQALYRNIQKFLSLTASGTSVEIAAKQAGISMNLVKRLHELGMSD
ncbi:MAG TPA: hypothetical protein V6D15_00370 [Oculatellaceae cyanobacterium]|jgi:hypothetical protein